ncbi:MAG: hypothetical protein IH851_10040 [Armatimonadetes bacterium]|nr:hypothetical protein [Armatimonadota bacterium]
MNDIQRLLKRFALRVRLVRGWRGLAVGGLFGAGAGVVWASLDYFAVALTNWGYLAAVAGGGAVVGTIVGLLLPVSAAALSASIDRRAGLDDRLRSALERAAKGGAFDEALVQDATGHLGRVKAARTFPIRFGRWQAGFIALAALAGAIFLLGNSTLWMSEDQKRERAEMQQAAEQIKRIAKPFVERMQEEELTADERELLDRLQRLVSRLERGRMPKEEALKTANELAKEAEELIRERFLKSSESLKKARELLAGDIAKRMEEETGTPVDAELMRKMMESMDGPPPDFAAQRAAVQEQIDALNSLLANSGSGLSDSARQALEEQLTGLQEAMREIELSQKAREFLERLYAQPEYRELMEILRELAKASEAGQQGQQALTDEQIQEMIRRLEELADLLADDEALREWLRELIEKMKDLEIGGECQSCMGGLMASLGIMPGMGRGGADEQFLYPDTGYVPQVGEEQTIEAKTDPFAVRGQRAEQGTETYIEIRGPSGLGERSSTPYTDVLPEYERVAEDAIEKQKIPPSHQKRVREYFESLGSGG